MLATNDKDVLVKVVLAATAGGISCSGGFALMIDQVSQRYRFKNDV